MGKQKRSIPKKKRSAPQAKRPTTEWWEEDWALPVLILFGVGMFIVVKDMRAEALARQAQAQAQTGAQTRVPQQLPR